MRRDAKSRQRFRIAHAAGLVPLAVVIVLSVTLGLQIPDDRRALSAALVTATVAAIGLVVAVWTVVSQRRKVPTLMSVDRVESRPYLIPRELPPGTAGFVGRYQEIDKLRRAINRHRNLEPFVGVIYGASGVGKSALAITVAHSVAASFPEGQLFVRVRRAGEQRAVVDDLVTHFVTALRGPGDPSPADAKDLQDEYAQLTMDRSVLFVLDDIPPGFDIAAIRPANPRCAIIVTCRDRPTWPDVTYEPVLLEPLEPSDALDMLRQTIGPDRVDNEEEPSRDLVRQCGRQPLALRVAGTAVANRPDWDLRLILALASKSAGSTGDVPAGGTFNAAYALLTADEQRALRVLGILEAAAFTPWMLAAALETTVAAGGRLASRLADAGLIEPYSQGSGTSSYRAEEPVLNFALQRAATEGGTIDVMHLRQLVEAERNRRERGADEKIRSLDQLLADYGGYASAIESVRNAMSLARERGSRPGRASACAALAELYTDLGMMIAADDLAQRAIRIGSDSSQARAHRCLTRIERRRHHLSVASEHADQAMIHALHAGDQAEQVRILQEKAVVLALCGTVTESERISKDAEQLCHALGDAGRSLLPGVMWSRGAALLQARQHDEAARVLQDGGQIAEDSGQERLGAWIDQVRAHVALAAGDLETGERHAARGADVFIKLRNSYGTAHCQYRLGQIHLRCRRLDEAVWSFRGALESFRNCDDTWMETEASLQLADTYRYRGQVQNAVRIQRIARRNYRRLGDDAQARRAAWMLLRTLFAPILRQRNEKGRGTGFHPKLG